MACRNRLTSHQDVPAGQALSSVEQERVILDSPAISASSGPQHLPPPCATCPRPSSRLSQDSSIPVAGFKPTSGSKRILARERSCLGSTRAAFWKSTPNLFYQQANSDVLPRIQQPPLACFPSRGLLWREVTGSGSLACSLGPGPRHDCLPRPQLVSTESSPWNHGGRLDIDLTVPTSFTCYKSVFRIFTTTIYYFYHFKMQ